MDSADEGTPFVLSRPESEGTKAFEKIVDKILEVKSAQANTK